MPTLLEYYNNDFKDLSIDSDISMDLSKSDENGHIVPIGQLIIKMRVKSEMNSSSLIFTFYIPETTLTTRMILSLLDNLDAYKKQIKEVEVIGGFLNDIDVGVHNSTFSSRVFFYVETPPLKEEISQLEVYCKDKNIYLTIRSLDYVKTRMRNETPLAFISHDSRNKELIARPLANGLNSRLCTVWYDEYSLKVGMSLRESIEDGIKKAKKCILVLTKEFLENPGWTRKEFNSIFTREMIFNERVVIPIWFNVKKEEVYEYSPSLADTVALIWPNPSNLTDDEYKVEVEKLISKIHTAVTAENSKDS
ncbi:MAG TPA: toll/interleukin-1 receptor domain-containing protein [Candidatus Paceibacterota bacterium]